MCVTIGVCSIFVVAGLDYTSINSLLLVFDEDTTRTCFNIVILEDDAFEHLESFRVYLSFSSDGELLSGATEATVTIVDSDRK